MPQQPSPSVQVPQQPLTRTPITIDASEPSDSGMDTPMDSAFESDAFSEETPSDSELRQFYKKYMKRPRSEQHRSL
eukprot:15171386-Alexandrium_andersonii.AAC.1